MSARARSAAASSVLRTLTARAQAPILIYWNQNRRSFAMPGRQFAVLL